MNHDDYYSPKQLADRWGITKQRLNLWLTKGRIPFVRIAGRRVIPASAAKIKPNPKIGRPKKTAEKPAKCG